MPNRGSPNGANHREQHRASGRSPLKLALGTVQFGLDYGISNRQAQTSLEEARSIVDRGLDAGLDLLDTAPGYGVSEAVLGEILGDRAPRIVTKTPQFRRQRIERKDGRLLRESLFRSLEHLRRERVYGLLVHAADDLLKPGGEWLYATMVDLREEGLVQRLGVSVYTQEQLDRVRARHDIQIVQVPVNVLDQRLLHSGVLDSLSRSGVEVHARSAFLQGALLMDGENLPACFSKYRDHFAEYRTFISDRGWSPVQAALGFVLALPQVDRVVCGVNNLAQWQELIQVTRQSIESSDLCRFGLDDEAALNPSRWENP